MSTTLNLLETKLKKHNWNWSKSSDPEEQVRGKNNFADIERLVKQAAKENLANEAYALIGKYRK